jgi:23S rRNA (pseudouridine1915-N3)-methyltransferase
MRIGIAAVGRLKAGPERELVARYLGRAGSTGRSIGLSGFEIAEFPESRAAAAAQRQHEEAVLLSGAIAGGTHLIVLDERGISMTSAALTDWIRDWRDAGTSGLWFAIGGPDGLDASIRKRADLVLGFSPLTWPHQLARIMLAEQLYRVTTILTGHPYHRGG